MVRLKRKHLTLLVILLTLICILYPFFRTKIISGKLLYVEEPSTFSESKNVKVRTLDGEFLNLLLVDDDLFFDNKPKKIAVTRDNKTIEVSLERLLNSVFQGQDNIPDGGVDTTIKYNPNIVKKFWFFEREDGIVKEINCKITNNQRGEQELFQISEISRTNEKPYRIKYSYIYKGAFQDSWYLINGETGTVTSYIKQGDKFIEKRYYDFNSKPVIRFKEEMVTPTSILINPTKDSKGIFEISFPNKEKMLEKSYQIEKALTSMINEGTKQ